MGAAHVDSRVDNFNGYQRFAECGLSQRTTAVLLSMAPDRIRLLQGIGPILMKEIDQYRATQLK